MTPSMSFAPIAFAKSSTRCRMRVSVTSFSMLLNGDECRWPVAQHRRRPIAFARSRSPTPPFDSARNPAEINSPLVKGDVDGGEREIRSDKKNNEDPDRECQPLAHGC